MLETTHLGFTCGGIDEPSQCRAQAIHVAAAVNGLDAVCKTDQRVSECVTNPLERQFNFHTLRCARTCGWLMEWHIVAIQPAVPPQFAAAIKYRLG
jgi:hypothetical protein